MENGAVIRSNQQSLDQIEADIKQKNICPDLAKTATNLVMGSGNPSAEIVFIGEAPGKNEDIQGKPFVGASGKFLDEMLLSVGLDREDIYITNIVKYRPPNNRDPSSDEKKVFWPYLMQQIKVIKPKIIVTLGRHSMEYFLPDSRIAEIHGQPQKVKLDFDKTSQELDSLVVLPLYHPAAALYNGSLRQTLLEDFKIVIEIIKQLDNKGSNN